MSIDKGRYKMVITNKSKNVFKAVCLSLLMLMTASCANKEEDVSESLPMEEESFVETVDSEEPEEPEPVVDDGTAEINDIISKMTLHDKVCQMMIVTPESITGVGVAVQAGDATKEALANTPVGGVIYFSQNFDSIDQTKEMLSNTKKFAVENKSIPLFIAVDEEGGTVARVSDTLGTTAFNDMYQYKDMGADTAYSNAKTIASDISALGFDLDFAPVADTWSNPGNYVIGTRAYSDDFSQTAELIPNAVKGFHDGGVCCSLKHFPGHGDTDADPHYGMATSGKTLAELETQEYLSFKSGIEAGADMVMMGHITMTNVDNLPASLSQKMIQEELRGKLGFNGVVITDSLLMGAVTEGYSNAELAVAAVKAGNDILLMPQDPVEAASAIEAAVTSGEISEERINDSVRRILTLKKQRLNWNP